MSLMRCPYRNLLQSRSEQAKANVNEKPVISVSANVPLDLDLRWSGGRQLLHVRAGTAFSG